MGAPLEVHAVAEEAVELPQLLDPLVLGVFMLVERLVLLLKSFHNSLTGKITNGKCHIALTFAHFKVICATVASSNYLSDMQMQTFLISHDLLFKFTIPHNLHYTHETPIQW